MPHTGGINLFLFLFEGRSTASPAMLHALLLLAMTPAGRHCLLLGRACMSL